MGVTQRLLEPARRVTVVYKQRLDERDTPLQAEVTWTPPACVVASLTGWLNEPQPVHEPSRSHVRTNVTDNNADAMQMFRIGVFFFFV